MKLLIHGRNNNSIFNNLNSSLYCNNAEKSVCGETYVPFMAYFHWPSRHIK